MTGLYVFLGIVVLVFFLLFCPVSLYVSFKESFFLKGKFLLIPFAIYPYPPKKPKKKRQKAAQTKEKTKEKGKSKVHCIIEEKGLGSFLNIAKKMIYIAAGALKELFQHMQVDNLTVDITVSAEDAAQTAIDYGKTCAVVYPLLSLILKNNYKRKYDVSIQSDFSLAESKVFFEMGIHIKLFYIVITALVALFKFAKVYIKN